IAPPGVPTTVLFSAPSGIRYTNTEHDTTTYPSGLVCPFDAQRRRSDGRRQTAVSGTVRRLPWRGRNRRRARPKRRGGTAGPRPTTAEPLRIATLNVSPLACFPASQLPTGDAEPPAPLFMTLGPPPAPVGGGARAAPAEGQRFFFGKGNCAGCHVIRGMPFTP